MVFIKAVFDNEIRKLAVESDISYSDLVQKLLRAFPSLGEQNPDDVRLYYRDADGDHICLGTDEELQVAFEHVGADNTVRVIIGLEVKKSTPSLGLMDADFFSDTWSGDPFFHHGIPALFNVFGHHQHHSPIGAFFRERQHALRESEERLRQQRLYEEKVRRADIERRKALMERAKEAREERMKQLEEARRKSQELSSAPALKETRSPAIPDFPPGWAVKPFGSWEPVVHEGPQFTQWTWGPYGYHATYGEEKMETEKQEEPKEDQPPKSTDAADSNQ